jgi:Family of unknown function (DUF6326)
MNTQKISPNSFEDIKVNVKLKLATLWTSFMFLYIYVDHFGLYKPGTVKDILIGRVFTFDISQAFLFTALFLTTIPALMIFLSVALPAKASRLTNLIITSIYIPYTLFNLIGDFWMYLIYGAFIEVILLLLIIRYAWKWPHIETKK